jgi:hypothetical protein
VPGHHPGRVAPFGNLGIAGCQRLPRAFRGVAASFLGRQRLGIHRAPIFADPSPRTPAPRSRRRPAAGCPTSPAHAGGNPSFGRPALPDPAGAAGPVRRAGPPTRPSLVKVRPTRWSRGDSNPGPPPCKGGALPAKLRPRLEAASPTPQARSGIGTAPHRSARATPPPACVLGALRLGACCPWLGGWARLDSNQGPRPYQGRALTA